MAMAGNETPPPGHVLMSYSPYQYSTDHPSPPHLMSVSAWGNILAILWHAFLIHATTTTQFSGQTNCNFQLHSKCL